MKTMETPRKKLALDGLRVETFEPRPRATEIEFAPPTNPVGSMPPCCSEQYICI